MDDRYEPTVIRNTKSTGNDPISILMPLTESESEYESDIEIDDIGVNTDITISATEFTIIFKDKNLITYSYQFLSYS